MKKQSNKSGAAKKTARKQVKSPAVKGKAKRETVKVKVSRKPAVKAKGKAKGGKANTVKPVVRDSKPKAERIRIEPSAQGVMPTPKRLCVTYGNNSGFAKYHFAYAFRFGKDAGESIEWSEGSVIPARTIGEGKYGFCFFEVKVDNMKLDKAVQFKRTGYVKPFESLSFTTPAGTVVDVPAGKRLEAMFHADLRGYAVCRFRKGGKFVYFTAEFPREKNTAKQSKDRLVIKA